ncbi:MAG: hypothetical protein K1V87_09830 [Muribaculum sp.]
MEEKIINEKESIELIARMISDTKSRLEVGDGNILLYWGLLTVAVATIVWCAVTITGNAAYNGLWGLLAFGWLFNYRLTKEKKSRGYRSYTDKMCSVIWTTVGVLGLCGVVMCVVFQYATGYSSWFAMFLYALIIVGSGVVGSGAALKIKSMVYGGAFSILYGMVIMCCILTGVALDFIWMMPGFILCFALMMIVPGIEMRRLARKGHERA